MLKKTNPVAETLPDMKFQSIPADLNTSIMVGYVSCRYPLSSDFDTHLTSVMSSSVWGVRDVFPVYDMRYHQVCFRYICPSLLYVCSVVQRNLSIERESSPVSSQTSLMAVSSMDSSGS